MTDMEALSNGLYLKRKNTLIKLFIEPQSTIMFDVRPITKSIVLMIKSCSLFTRTRSFDLCYWYRLKLLYCWKKKIILNMCVTYVLLAFKTVLLRERVICSPKQWISTIQNLSTNRLCHCKLKYRKTWCKYIGMFCF